MSDEITSGDIAAAVKDAAPAEASPAPHPQPTETPVPPPIVAAAKVEPTKDEFGDVPFPRHEAILAKTRRDYDEKLSRLSWAEKHDPQVVEEALRLRTLYERDPQRLHQALAQRITTTQAPAPDVTDEHGQPYYSPKQAAALARYEAEQLINERMGVLEQRLAPIESERQQAEQAEGFSRQISTASQWPGFTDHLDAITAAIAAANERHERLTLHDAYIQVVVPTLTATDEQRRVEAKKAVLAEMSKTTAATTSDLNPGRVPAASHKADKDKSMKELLREEFAKAGAA